MKSLLAVLSAFCLVIPAAAQSPASDWDLLRQIVLVPGISGQEDGVMDWIQARLQEEGSAISHSASLVAFEKGYWSMEPESTAAKVALTLRVRTGEHWGPANQRLSGSCLPSSRGA